MPHKDRNKKFCQIAEESNFICNDYKVITQDGYILNMYRIRSIQVANMKIGEAPAVLL